MAFQRPCALQCDPGDTNDSGGIGSNTVYDETASQPGRQRWDVGVDLADLPAPGVGELRITRLDP